MILKWKLKHGRVIWYTFVSACRWGRRCTRGCADWLEGKGPLTLGRSRNSAERDFTTVGTNRQTLHWGFCEGKVKRRGDPGQGSWNQAAGQELSRLRGDEVPLSATTLHLILTPHQVRTTYLDQLWAWRVRSAGHNFCYSFMSVSFHSQVQEKCTLWAQAR